MPIGYLNGTNLRATDGALGQDKGWMLTTLYWHTNANGRCWPGMRKLAKNLGCASEKADKIMDWLIEHGAIIKVPYGCRILEEKKLAPRKTVYQLTGVIKLTKWQPYISIENPETAYSLACLVNNLKGDNPLHFSIIEFLISEFSIIKVLISETEGIKGIGIEGNPVRGKVKAKSAPPKPTQSKANSAPNPNAATPLSPSDPLADSMDQRYAAYIYSWRDALPGFPLPLPQRHAWTDAIDKAKEMHKVGITPSDVTAYVKERQKDPKKSLAVNFVFQDIYTWMNAKQPKPSAPPKYYEPEPQNAALTSEEIEAIKKEVQHG